MIRQDYLMRLAQRLAQALAQVLFYKSRQEYDRAEAEIDAALTECFGLERGALPDLEELLNLCARESVALPDNLVRLADIFREKGEIQRLRGDTEAAAQTDALALGLFLEVLQRNVVSMELIQKADQLIERISGVRLPGPVLKRLLGYYEARGMLDRAEDALYEWLDTKDPDSPEGGLAFYGRLSTKSDGDLASGGLSREEVEQGRAEWLRVSSSSGKQ
jgi:tetratricopeptide (TPR) repeat protein